MPENGSQTEPKIRERNGLFAKGNNAAKGRSCAYSSKIMEWRAVMVKCITEDHIRAALGKLTKAAGEGQRWAIVELLSRTCGTPPSFEQPMLVERIDEIERILTERLAELSKTNGGGSRLQHALDATAS